MKRLKILLFAGCLLMASNLCAQNMSDMRLNEFLVINTNDFQDDFGQQNSWFELYNTSYGTVDIGGCYLTNDPNDLKKYIIPKGDVLTKIKPRQHILFWADGQPYRGTFHVSFSLEDSDEIIFVSSDGKTIIDRVKIPKEMKSMPNISYGRPMDGIGSKDGSNEGWQIMERTSPSTNNFGVDAETKSMIMSKTDSHGMIMTVTAMTVVFIALIILYIVFRILGKKAFTQKVKTAEETSGRKIDRASITGEAYAAIAVALHLYSAEDEAHDFESLALTINKVRRSYSPWSSKIYSLRETPVVTKNRK